MEEKTRENMIIMAMDSGESVGFYVLEKTRIDTRSYLLVTGAPEGEDGERYIPKDMSGQQDAEAVYESVEDNSELDVLMRVFEELLSNADVDLEEQIERKIGGTNLNLGEKGNTTEAAPEVATQVTIQAIQKNNAQETGVRETAGTTVPQKQPVKKPQDRRSTRKKTVSKEQGGNGEAQKNPGLRQGQTKGRIGQRGEVQTGIAISKSKDSTGTRTSKGTGSPKTSRNSGESKAARNSGESKAFSASARQKGRGGRRDGRDKLKIISSGDLERIGMNIACFLYISPSPRDS